MDDYNEVIFTVDLGGLERDLGHLDSWDLRFLLAMDGVLTRQFQATQDRVHILTGSLKASGKYHSFIEGGAWEGEIIYGGELASAPVPGPPPPGRRNREPGVVYYAGYEQRRGGAHDFMEAAQGFEGDYEDVILAYLSGDL